MRNLIVILLAVSSLWTAYPFLYAPPAPGPETQIMVDKAINRLYLYQGGKLTKTYPVATGRTPELTPEGRFQVIEKEASPDGLGEDRIFGTRWLGLSSDGQKHGIHGTNDPKSIGRHASAGCIRLHNQDMEELYAVIPMGTPVTIRKGSPFHRRLVDFIHRAARTG